MSRRIKNRLLAMWGAIVVVSALSTAQSRPIGEPELLRSQPVSSAVIATWSLTSGDAGNDRLRFLVLWRGTPGWLWPGPFSTSGNARGGDERTGEPPQSIGQQIFVGDIVFGVTLDPRNAVIQVGNQEFDLRKVNVFLVDRLDEPAALRVVRSLWVQPDIRPGDGFEAVIRREPELRNFVRCDAVLDDPVKEQIARVLCTRILG